VVLEFWKEIYREKGEGQFFPILSFTF
jgi:hypothetical protein